MSYKVKVGVFGAARGMTMIDIMASHADAELVAICDKHEPLLEKCKKYVQAVGLKTTCYSF